MLKISKIISALEINSRQVNDIIDYHFFQAENHVQLHLERNNRKFKVNITKKIDQHLGLEFHPDRILRCNNNCIFCFCHNNPKQLRRSLYIKDDDYRHSFLHGNFITLTNLSEDDIQRIIKLRLSPLYISVQATDNTVRQKLFGRKNVKPALPILHRLAENEIYFHCQVVIVPGFNDDSILSKTAADLAELRPYATSLAIVPVGLTKFSNPKLKPVGPKKSVKLINNINKLRKKYGRKENRFAYAADELYVNAGLDIPLNSYYDDFPQIENGVGMVSDFLNTFPKKLPSKINGYWITGKSMMKIWCKYIIPKYGFKIKLIPVANNLFGKRVTVTGLLSGEDVTTKLSMTKSKDEPVIIPPNCLNADGLFIDDLTVEDVESELGISVINGTYNFAETLKLVS
jgi:putative radical SAM enzyme (TIGR03279 family)